MVERREPRGEEGARLLAQEVFLRTQSLLRERKLLPFQSTYSPLGVAEKEGVFTIWGQAYLWIREQLKCLDVSLLPLVDSSNQLFQVCLREKRSLFPFKKTAFEVEMIKKGNSEITETTTLLVYRDGKAKVYSRYYSSGYAPGGYVFPAFVESQKVKASEGEVKVFKTILETLLAVSRDFNWGQDSLFDSQEEE